MKKFPHWALYLIFGASIALMILLLSASSADAQGYTVRENLTAPGWGKSYTITPNESKTYTGSGAGSYSSPSTSRGLTSTMTPHWMLRPQSALGYYGFYQSREHCMNMLRWLLALKNPYIKALTCEYKP